MSRNFHLPFSGRSALYVLDILDIRTVSRTEPMHPNDVTGKAKYVGAKWSPLSQAESRPQLHVSPRLYFRRVFPVVSRAEQQIRRLALYVKPIVRAIKSIMRQR